MEQNERNPESTRSELVWFSKQQARNPDQQLGNALPHVGGLCPICQAEVLDYDGLLNLSCPRCGVILGGCFT